MNHRRNNKYVVIILTVMLFFITLLLVIHLSHPASSVSDILNNENKENNNNYEDDLTDKDSNREETDDNVNKSDDNNKVDKLYSTFPLFSGYQEYIFVENLIAFARTQIGECEGTKGYTKYGEFFGHPYEAWCTEFVIYCVSQTEKETGQTYLKLYYPKTDYSGGCVDFYTKKGWFFKRGTFVPRPGDIIVFDYNYDGITDHTGLVTGVEYDQNEDKLYILTIEGNIPEDEPGGEVRERRLPADWEKIYGYGTFLISE